MSFLPSQRFIIILLLLILAGTSVYAYTIYRERISSKESAELFKQATGKLNIVLTSESVKNEDTDKDGISNIEESLLGLDPNNDSTEEKKLLDKQRAEKEEKFGDILTYLSSKKDTKSDIFAKELYIASQNESLDSNSLNTSSNERLKNMIPRGTFTIANLKSLDKNSTKLMYDNYILKYLEYLTITDTDLKKFSTSFDKKGNINIKNLFYIKNKAVKGKEFLSAISYPEEIKPFFVEHINTLIYIDNIIDSLIKNKVDPLISYSGLMQLQPALEELTSQYEQFKK